MLVNIKLNGKSVVSDIAADMTLYDFVRKHGCYSVKCGCETSNCGLCTVFLDEKPVLSCSVLAVRADKCSVTTLEGIQEEASEFVTFIADQGAEQCGFCNPGFVMNAIALFRENPYPEISAGVQVTKGSSEEFLIILKLKKKRSYSNESS